MPEGPEVETVRRTLEGALVGARLDAVNIGTKALRAPSRPRELRRLMGQRVVALGRHGKLLWIELEEGHGIWVRLGMSGRLTVQDASAPVAPHTHVRIALASSSSARRELRFVDPRRFGAVVPYASTALLAAERARMGPDALLLTGDDEAIVLRRLARTSRTLKDALLDQSVLAGVGNIYASEALFEARLSPFLPGSALGDTDGYRLLAACRRVLWSAVEKGGTTFLDYVDGTGRRGENLAHLFVFRREGEPCRVCAHAIERVVQGGRSTFYCPSCQPARPSLR